MLNCGRWGSNHAVQLHNLYRTLSTYCSYDVLAVAEPAQDVVNICLEFDILWILADRFRSTGDLQCYA